MGYLATRLATTFAAADNVTYYDTAQRISALDALTSSKIVKWLLPEADKFLTAAPSLPISLASSQHISQTYSAYQDVMLARLSWPPIRFYELDANTGQTKDVSAEHKHDRLFKITTDAKGRRSFVVRKTKKAELRTKQGAKDNDKGNPKPAAKESKKLGEVQTDGKQGKDDVKPVTDDKRGKAFTSDEDAKLKAMKAENKTWKDIMEALGRGKSELQARFKELQNTGTDGKKDETKANKQANDQKADERKAKQKNKPEKAEKVSIMVNPNDDEARFTMKEWQTLQEDDLFTFSELQFLSEIILKEGTEDWLKISSMFYDNTGRRVHPDDIRDKFAQLNAMLGRN